MREDFYILSFFCILSVVTTALLIVDHGSKRQAANDMLEDVACGLREKRPGLLVEIAHMELADPTIEMGIQSCVDFGATFIVVHPFMLSPGRHATEDVPRMVAQAMIRHPNVGYRVVDYLGVHDKLLDVILDRADL